MFPYLVLTIFFFRGITLKVMMMMMIMIMMASLSRAPQRA